MIYGLTQDCQIIFLRPSQIALLSTLNVNIYNAYCHPNLVQLHLQSSDSLLLVTKQAGNRICTLNVTIPPFDLLFGNHIFSYSIFNSLSYAVCSHSPPNSYQLETDLSFLDTLYNNVIYFVNGQSEGKEWNALQFLINPEGYLRYLDKFTIQNNGKREWTGPDIANEYVVGLDTQRNLLFKRNRFQSTYQCECAYDLLFNPNLVKTQYGNDSSFSSGLWLNSLAADSNVLLFSETDRTLSPPITYVRSKNISNPDKSASSYCLTSIPFSLDLGIVRESTLKNIQKNPLPPFDTNTKPKKPLSVSLTTHRHRKTTLKALAPEVTTINSIITSTSQIRLELTDDDLQEDSVEQNGVENEEDEDDEEEEINEDADESTVESDDSGDRSTQPSDITFSAAGDGLDLENSSGMTVEEIMMDELMDNSTESTDSLCHYIPPPMTELRFWLVTVFGSIISFISIANNILLFYNFLTKKHHRTNYNIYLMLLAFFDVFVSIAYILLMSVNVLSDYLQSALLLKIWYIYMVPMITISHIAMTSSSNLIVAATFERYCMTVNMKSLPFVQRNRKLFAFLAIFLGIVSKGTMFLEFEIYVNPECEGTMSATNIAYRQFVFGTPYNIVWRFWYRNFVTIFAPFFILAILNIRIVKALTIHTKLTVCQLAGNAAVEQAKRKATVRAATRTLVLVVCCYLISNIINVALTIWEHLDKEGLQSRYINLYVIAVDMVSLLTTLACACRLPIYLSCQVALRTEILDILKNLFSCESKNKKNKENEYLVGNDKRFSITITTRTTALECSQEGKETPLSILPIDGDEEDDFSLIGKDSIQTPDDLKHFLPHSYETTL
ncbi:unnamed protein product [Auanema sp. JU1783]|nr:unnamed protein product [Auanema sp. JU1783]